KYSHPDRTPVISIDSIIKDEKITISVSDNGIGIDLDKYGKDIFGLYKTFHTNKSAEGIGLYITKNQVESLGAEIQVKSKVNEGTTMIISTKQKKTS
ncbi:MAG: ATP-binding protein, partial [Aquaticitalea sp.]